MSFGFCIPCSTSCCKGNPVKSSRKNSDGIPSMFKPISVDSPASILKLPRRASPEDSLNTETLKNSQSIYPDHLSSSDRTWKSSYSISSLYGFDLNDEEDEEFLMPLLPRSRTDSNFEFRSHSSGLTVSTSGPSGRGGGGGSHPLLYPGGIFQEIRPLPPQTKSLDFLQLNLKHIDSETSSEISSLTCGKIKCGRGGSNKVKTTPPVITTSLEQKLIEPYYRTSINIEIVPSRRASNDSNLSGTKQFPGLSYKGRQTDYKSEFIQSLRSTSVKKTDLENKNLKVNNETKRQTNNVQGASENYFSKTPSPNLSFFSNDLRVSENEIDSGQGDSNLPLSAQCSLTTPDFPKREVEVDDDRQNSNRESESFISPLHLESKRFSVTSVPDEALNTQYISECKVTQEDYISPSVEKVNEEFCQINQNLKEILLEGLELWPVKNKEEQELDSTGESKGVQKEQEIPTPVETIELNLEEEVKEESSNFLTSVTSDQDKTVDLTLTDLPKFNEALLRVQDYLKSLRDYQMLSAMASLTQHPKFQPLVAVHDQIQETIQSPLIPSTLSLKNKVEECLPALYNPTLRTRQEASELLNILSTIDFESLVECHDIIAERQSQLMADDSTMTPICGYSADGVELDTLIHSTTLPDRETKIVYVEKTDEPLGVTVLNEDNKMLVGRIITGGTVERMGLLNEGDEIIEINDISMEGKSINYICDILYGLTGTLKFCIVPSPCKTLNENKDPRIPILVRAQFNYEHKYDALIPCRELGLSFNKGDILRVTNQDDLNWWQAQHQGEPDLLAGLIPSKSFQEERTRIEREDLKQLSLDTYSGVSNGSETSKTTLLRKKLEKKLKRKSTQSLEDFTPLETPSYEEVALYFPKPNFKRPIVLIGPSNTGRHELSQMLLRKSDSFAAPVPHTTRSQKFGEMEGHDYYFVSKPQFESAIMEQRFIEHGIYEKSYYGTSFNAVVDVMQSNKTCIINLNPKSLSGLRLPEIKPYVIFISPPPYDRLKVIRLLRGESCKEEELNEIIQRGFEMEENFGHYFDTVIINNDLETSCATLKEIVIRLEREPQWVPAFWLKT